MAFGFGFGFSRLYAALSAVFSPASLFAAGEQGTWYDPSDLTTLFQDSAGTTPVTAVQQPVGLMLDKSKGLVLGPKIVDDNFSTDTSGWASYTNITETASVSTANGNLVVTTQRSDGTSGAKKLLTGLTAGKWYKATARIKKTTDPSANLATANLRFVNGDATASWVASYSTTSTSFVEATIYFSPTGTTGNLGLVSGGTALTVSSYVMEYDDVVVQEIAGNHAFQTTSASRPVLSARYNLLTKTEQFDDAVWLKDAGVTVTPNFGIAPDGMMTAARVVFSGSSQLIRQVTAAASGPQYTGAIWVKGTASQTIQIATTGTDDLVTLTGEWQLYSGTKNFITANFIINTYGGATARDILVWHPDLRVANDALSQPAYQRVNTSTDYDTVGFKPYLAFDGVDDSLVTNSIDFTATDKMTVFAGVRKLSDATQIIAELSSVVDTSNGAFAFGSITGSSNYFSALRGTLLAYFTETTYAAPITNVHTTSYDIAGALIAQEITPRANGVTPTLAATGTNAGTGNFGNYPLFIGRRNNASLPFNGRIYSLIVRGAASTTAQITSTEGWVNQRTGAYT